MRRSIFILFISVLNLQAVAQNVGIGIANPSRAKLEVEGAVDATSAIFGGESSGVSLQRNWPGIGFNQYYNAGGKYIGHGYAAVQFVDPTSGYMGIDMFGYGSPNSSTSDFRRVMVLTNQGRVNFGSASLPYANLNVSRGNPINIHYATASFEGTRHHSFFNYSTEENTYIRAGKDYGTVFINDIPGGKTLIQNVGVNGANGFGYPLEVSQSNDKGILIRNLNDRWGLTVNTGFFTLRYNDVHKGYFNYSDGKYTNISDRRLKTNINTLPPLLGKVMQLEAVDYEMIYNNPLHKKSIGFIAQEVKKYFPELVTVIADTATGYKDINDLHTLDYSSLSVITIKAIQEQQVLINNLKDKMQALEKEVKVLKEFRKK